MSADIVKTTKARTRLQRLLNKIAGGDTSVNVKSKDEILLNEIAENGGSGGGGGGVNVLTLYMGTKDGVDWAYKDPERTEEYATYDEAYSALNDADVVTIIPQVSSSSPVIKIFGGYGWAIVPGNGEGLVAVVNADRGPVYLWKEPTPQEA